MSADAVGAEGAVATKAKSRAVVFGGGMGIFPPLMTRFQAAFDIVGHLESAYPKAWEWASLVLSFRPTKDAWYRNWRKILEHSPFTFKLVTRGNERLLAPYEGRYDFLLWLGAMSLPSRKLDKPLFVFTDSCRRLSSLNKYDESCHFDSPKEEREWFRLEGDVYKRARRIFVGSQFVKDSLVSFYGVEERRVVVCGFGAGQAFGEWAEKTFDGRTILYVGKGDFKKKGGELLLEAFKRVRRELPQAVLHVVGQPNLASNEAEGLVSHGLVRDREKLLQLNRAAHVATLPSLVDRFGIALVEAMATGTPCVASDYGALPEVVGDAGLVVPCEDADALATALLSLLRDEPRARKLGELGRKRFEQIYNWDSIWTRIHAEILAGLRE
jgi:glycosyltransferase involved in cell wall biosynthesis